MKLFSVYYPPISLLGFVVPRSRCRLGRPANPKSGTGSSYNLFEIFDMSDSILLNRIFSIRHDKRWPIFSWNLTQAIFWQVIAYNYFS